MITIKGLASNKKAFISLMRIQRRTEKGIRAAFYDFGKDLKQESRKLIKDPPKTGKIYRLMLRGRVVFHQASAPGEPPANFTGKLRKSVGYDVSQANQITFGAGNNQDVNYARKLELGGGNIKERPFLLPAINRNEREAYDHLRTNLKRELCR